MAKKKKLKTIGALKEAASVLLQRFVRLKAADDEGYCTCVSCGAVKQWDDNMQGGHYIPRGCSETRLLEENVHPQCSYCNAFAMKSGIAAHTYTLFMNDMYGREFVDNLIAKFKAQAPYKWIRADLDDTIAELKLKIKDEEVRLGV